MGIQDHLTGLLRNLYAGQEATVRTEHETADSFQIGKGVRQEEISVTSEMQMTPTLWQKVKTKEPLDESGRGE